MTDPRSTDPESTQRHEIPAEPAPPPVIRTSGEPERYSPPPPEARPEWTRHEPAPTAAATPERWYEPAATVPATPLQEGPVKGGSGTNHGMGSILGAALLAAVLASGGTVVALSASGALDKPSAATTTTPTGTTIGATNQPVTID